MEHQLEFWGSFSTSIREYVESGILDGLDDPTKRDLLEYIDPFTYRSELDIPKLIVVGTNDPYWPIDASRLYIDELSGYSSMVYAANAGHEYEVFTVTQAISSMIHNLNTGEILSSLSISEERSGSSTKFIPTVERGDSELKELRILTSSSPEGHFKRSEFDFKVIEDNQELNSRLNNRQSITLRVFSLLVVRASYFNACVSIGQIT